MREKPRCPACNEKMDTTEYNTYECKNPKCPDKFICIPMSIIGIHQ